MHIESLVLASTLALVANAIPHAGHAHHHHMDAHKRQDQTFNIHVLNNCPDTLSFGLFSIDSSFTMTQQSTPVSISSGQQQTIPAPFQGIGYRLSGTADQGAAAQWDPQALFEFGYSTYAGQDGTAYDLSVMSGSPPNIGIAVYPMGGDTCPSKVCLPTNCPPGQGWTSPDQVDAGSPGDTVCYQGLQDFRVVWCPS